MVGDFKNNGRQWRPEGEPDEGRVHDFIDEELGKAIPYEERRARASRSVAGSTRRCRRSDATRIRQDVSEEALFPNLLDARSARLWYDRGMKRKTSVTLEEDIIDAVDRLAGKDESRSAVIERAVRALIALEKRGRREAKDREILRKHAAKLNEEAEDVLSFQVDL